LIIGRSEGVAGRADGEEELEAGDADCVGEEFDSIGFEGAGETLEVEGGSSVGEEMFEEDS